MGKFGQWLGTFAKGVGGPLVSGALSLAGQVLQRRLERKEYNRMLEYNSPKSQMKRYQEAGLSPYLIYGAANAGNASQPSPASYVPTQGIGKGIEEYMAIQNFQADLRIKNAQRRSIDQQTQLANSRNWNTEVSSLRKQLDTLADYPDFITTGGRSDRTVYSHEAGTSYRRKLNEMRLALSQAQMNRIESSIEGMNYDNIVRRIKSIYAEDYGMVGSDWTQGLGLIKSLPNFFKSKGNLTEYQKRILKRYPK